MLFGCHPVAENHRPEALCEALHLLKNEHHPLNEQKLALYELATEVMKRTSIKRRIAGLEELRAKTVAFKDALERHSEKEENHLFAMMGRHIGQHSGPLHVMEMEHEEAKSLITEFLEQTAEIKGDRSTVHEACRLIIEAYHVLTSHFMKEEQVLFPMAQQMLSDTEKAVLLEVVKEETYEQNR